MKPVKLGRITRLPLMDCKFRLNTKIYIMAIITTWQHSAFLLDIKRPVHYYCLFVKKKGRIELFNCKMIGLYLKSPILRIFQDHL